MFADVRDTQTNMIIAGRPRQSVFTSLAYSSPYLGMDISLMGRSTWWNMAPSQNPLDNRMIWDLLVKKYFDKQKRNYVYFSLYNLFNTPQWLTERFPLPLRLVEVGFRLSF